jgi:hypothetical protein
MSGRSPHGQKAPAEVGLLAGPSAVPSSAEKHGRIEKESAMKSVFTVVLASLALVHSWAQVALTPATTAISPSPVFVPGSPALSSPANANAVVTNATLLALSDSLLALQTNLEQTLPNLILFNDNFDFVSLGDNGTAATPASNPPGNFSVNFATNFAVNAGVNSAVPTGRSLFNTVANRTPVAAAGLPQGFAAVPVTRDTLRALLVLQSDIQRMMPVINALNAGITNAPGSFTNLFGIVPTTP